MYIRNRRANNATDEILKGLVECAAYNNGVSIIYTNEIEFIDGDNAVATVEGGIEDVSRRQLS